ncbi:NADP-dependent oxidoreductase domain-containing protein [Gautieria morchelliformis]|nr:NADP-dependent oxidoreductase domain-containing protein [Gautieria morchelliformis]
MAGPTIKLNTGAEIPLIGLGTWQSKPNEVANAVEYGLKCGYRHIDCAWAYDNQEEVGRGIRASGVPRDQIFITSKLWCTYHTRVEVNLDDTLKQLGTDYLDLYLIHWPVPLNPNGNHYKFPTLPDGTRDVDRSWSIRDTWKQMEKVYKDGKVKAIGVSNFSQMMLEKILPTAEIKPAVNQLELHLYNPQHKLLDYLASQGIVPQAYSPLGSADAPLLADETVVALSQKYGLDAATVLLGYLVAKNVVTLPKSVTPSRIASNLLGPVEFGKRVDKADLEILDSVAANGKQQRFIVPPWPVELGFDNWRK